MTITGNMLLPGWMERFRAGDLETLKDLYDTFFLPGVYFAHQLLGSEQDTEEFTSDILIKVWNKNQDFDIPKNIQAFIFISIKNRCFDELKRRRRERVRKSKFDSMYDYNPEGFADLMLIQTELLVLITQGIEALPEQCKKIFKMHYEEEMTNEQISQEMNLSINTIKSQKMRARRHLKDFLFEQRGE